MFMVSSLPAYKSDGLVHRPIWSSCPPNWRRRRCARMRCHSAVSHREPSVCCSGGPIHPPRDLFLRLLTCPAVASLQVADELVGLPFDLFQFVVSELAPP